MSSHSQSPLGQKELERLLFKAPRSLITDFLSKIAPSFQCQICANRDGWIVDASPSENEHVPRLSSWRKNDDVVTISGGYHLPVYRVTCNKCGHMQIFNAYVVLHRAQQLGMLQPDESDYE